MNLWYESETIMGYMLYRRGNLVPDHRLIQENTNFFSGKHKFLFTAVEISQQIFHILLSILEKYSLGA